MPWICLWGRTPEPLSEINEWDFRIVKDSRVMTHGGTIKKKAHITTHLFFYKTLRSLEKK